MPRIEQSIVIDAPVDRVYRIARDVERFPEYMEDLKALVVKERSEDGTRLVTEWTAIIREFKMQVKWTQEDTWSDDTHRDEFRLVQGDMDSMSGYWQFTSLAPDRTKFDSVLEYEYNVPLIGPMVKSLIKKKMTDNLSATLEAIKGRAEGQAR